MPRKRGDNGEERISVRDLEALEFIARYGVVPRSALAVKAGTGRSVTFDRVRRLRDAGLIESHPPIGSSTPLLVATRRGLRLVGRPELRPARLNLGTALHSIAAAHVGARNEARGRHVLSEREIAAEERLSGERVLSARRGSGFEHRYHSADLLVFDEAMTLVEIELTAKAPQRLGRIVSDWQYFVADNRAGVGRVVYLCTPETLRFVERAISDRTAQVVAMPLDLDDNQLPRLARQISGGEAEAVKGRRPDPRRGLTGSAPPLASRGSRGRGGMR